MSEISTRDRPGTLYVVATPIGNPEDITDRAKHVLSMVDLVAAEDTRTTRILLSALSIRNKTVSNHKFNERRQVDYIISMLLYGKNVAIVSDAGTPCISDPGGIIVEAAHTKGIGVVPVCGASAVTAALSVSGFTFGPFAFYGFFPKTEKGVRDMIKSAAREAGRSSARGSSAVSVFFESPMRITKTLRIISEEAPSARICLLNDISKRYERVYRGSVMTVFEDVSANPAVQKGEYTMVADFARAPSEHVGAVGYENLHRDEANDYCDSDSRPLSPEALIVDHIVKNGCEVKDAVNALAAARKGPKKTFYNAALRLKELFGDDERRRF